ncbi:alpha/beta hydrolase [Octadecabacter sp. R77987]|uniref:alpha/beta hydrolase n=1 Tax=Octadecabacter sp. R77987 TaxID=3093874 RepID=UPI003670A3BC
MNRIKEVTVENDSVTLCGSLVWSGPKHGSVVVLMLHGSGPLDRDGNMPGQKLDIFNTIADELVQAGISSYRYDKRGCGQSSGDYWASGLNELVKDACAAVDMLASLPDTDGIVLLGHSEGTMIAPIVAHLKPEVSGLILLCPTIQPVEETLMRQAGYFAKMVDQMPGMRGVITRLIAGMRGGIPKQQRTLIDRIKAADMGAFRSKGQSVPPKLLRGLLAHDPMSWIRKVQVPVLAIAGAKDIQCLPGDAKLIKELAAGPVENHCLSDLTHILRTDSAPASFDRYAELMAKKPDPRVTQLCIDWILKQG